MSRKCTRFSKRSHGVEKLAGVSDGVEEAETYLKWRINNESLMMVLEMARLVRNENGLEYREGFKRMKPEGRETINYTLTSTKLQQPQEAGAQGKVKLTQGLWERLMGVKVNWLVGVSKMDKREKIDR